MTESRARVAVPCPACSPEAAVVHEVLRSGGQATVRCRDCDHVHKTRVADPETTSITVIISQDGESVSTSTEIPVDESLAVGEEFVQETPEAIHQVRITSVELTDGHRVDSAVGENVETLWTRAVDNVSVDITVHPSDGSRTDSRSLTAYVPGDYEFTVGDTESFGDETFTVTMLHLRAAGTSDRESPIDRRGEAALAKDVKRILGTDESSSGWSAW